MGSAHKATLEQDHILPVNNVFNPNKGDACKVFYNVAAAGHVTIKLYTIDGVFIKTLVDKDVAAGTHSEDWYGVNMDNETVASGIYYVHIEGPGFKQTKKICVVK
jgi:flagellar hook assembly protein FlgD